MKFLSRQEEIVLLTIWKLKDNAYGVTIRRHISKITGKDWSMGAIYVPLYRLQDKGFVDSVLSEPTEERGGRSKRMYTVTDRGMDSLHDHKKIIDKIWEDTSDMAFGEPKF